MKKVILSALAVTLAACGDTPSISSATTKLYEVLTQQTNGGSKTRFFKVLSEPNDIKMLQIDENLTNKISKADFYTSNFVILNMGEKTTGGYSIGIDNLVETDKNIIITVKETSPEPGSMVTQAFTTPFCVVKINSKKEIIIK